MTTGAASSVQPGPGGIVGGAELLASSIQQKFSAFRYSYNRTARAATFAVGRPKHTGPATSGIQQVDALFNKLESGEADKLAGDITAQGMFFPCILLSSGWWQKGGKTSKPSIAWRDPVQEWLFRGFDEWAPSLDISLHAQPDAGPYLFAQLGAGDEAQSLLVIIPGEKAKEVRGYVASEGLTFAAQVTGRLTNRQHLPPALRQKLPRWGNAFDSCIQLDEDNKDHTVIPLSRALLTPYSGYLWQCVAPKALVQGKQLPELNEVYFVWEHTEFTQPDAVKYNLDSLLHKVEYLRSIHGDLVLLQKSSALVPGEPLYSSGVFSGAVLSGTLG